MGAVVTKRSVEVERLCLNALSPATFSLLLLFMLDT